MEKRGTINYILYSSINEIDSEIWNGLNHEDKTCLSTSYFQALEEAPPPGMKFRYGIFFLRGRPVGIAHFQLLPLRLNMIRRNLTVEKALKPRLTDHYLLICGNALLSGEYGYAHAPSVDSEDFIVSLDNALKEIRRTAPLSFHILCSLIKDTLPQNPDCLATINRKYYGFSLSPNLIIRSLDRFEDFDDFRNSMKSKYKRNLKSAENRGAGLIRKELDLVEIREKRIQIYDLYFQVHQKARFRICTLHPRFFETLKEKLPERFSLTAYYRNNEMVTFTTRFLSHNSTVMEGYAHGLDLQYNKSFALYQNILLDDIKTAINQGIPRVNMGRTSVGMKSAFGAEAENLFIFAGINKPFVEGVILPHVEMALPKPEPCRQPFEQC